VAFTKVLTIYALILHLFKANVCPLMMAEDGLSDYSMSGTG
jgi:hypothetical protein